MLHLRSVALFLAMSATAAFAQDGSEVVTNRTPAGAQKFLALNPPQYFLLPNPAFYQLKGGISAPEACKTVLTGLLGDLGPAGDLTTPATRMYVPAGTINATVSFDGKVLESVTPGGVADKAGLRVGDIVLNINGAPVSGGVDMNKKLSRLMYLGQTAKFTYRRGRTDAVAEMVVVLQNPQWPWDVDVDSSVLEPLTLTIDWSKVTSVLTKSVDSYNWLSIESTGAPHPFISFNYRSPEIRDRVAAAAQYLKANCNRSEDLGF